MQLNTLVAAYVYADIRMVTEFDGDRGWIQLTNLFLKKCESNGFFRVGRVKEVGVEVDNSYWIDLPSDCRGDRIIRIYYPYALISDARYRYRYEIVNGKIKLDVDLSMSKNDDPDTFTLSAGTTTTIKINDADATADLWNDYLLVLTNGTYSGDTIIIEDTAAAAGGTSTLTFLHTQDNTIDSTAGYLTDEYLMMKYYAAFTAMTSHTGEIPINDDYEDLLGYWLNWQGMTMGDKRRKEAEKMFKERWEELEAEHFTPTIEQARPKPRELVGYINADDFDDSEYIGDDDD